VVNASLAVLTYAAGGAMQLLAKDWRGWYRSLRKSRLSPPNWVFMVVWPILYGLIALAGVQARYYYEKPGASDASYALNVCALVLYYAQFPLNLLWTLCFFVLRMPGWGLAVISINLVTAIALDVLFWVIRWPPGLALLPYVAWLAFATYLNAYVVVMNRPDREAGLPPLVPRSRDA
jgi:tryptophan-rich sensory protein